MSNNIRQFMQNIAVADEALAPHGFARIDIRRAKATHAIATYRHTNGVILNLSISNKPHAENGIRRDCTKARQVAAC